MRSARWFYLLVTFFAFSIAGLAQDTGQITGTVKDSSGANVANAQVTVSSPEHGINRVTKTNADGDYLVGGLPGGTYNLSVTAPDFKNYQVKGIILHVGAKDRADATLQVGAASIEITVQGENVAQVETQSSDLAGTVTGKQITQLQLNGRNFTQLVTLVPGVSNQTGQDEGTVGVYGNVAFSFNGGRTVYNNWEIDGGDDMDNGSNFTLNVYPSIDAISEVRVLTSNYGAQYGRNGSGTVETELKSGTSSFHGDVYEFVRNEDFNANNYFNNLAAVPRPAYKKNDYGYTIGGPIYVPGVYNTKKDKTFFFWSQEWRKEHVPGQTFNQEVPSLTERLGDFSDLCPNVSSSTPSFADCPVIPGTNTPFNAGGQLNHVPIDPNAQALLALIPLPNNGVPGAEFYTASPVQPTNWREELLRVDHNFNSKLRASFHLVHDSWETITPVPLWSDGTSFPNIQTDFVGPGVSLVARLTANTSPTLLNEFVFSYTTDHIILRDTGFPNPNAWKRPASMTIGQLFNLPPPGGTPVIPGINVANGTAYGGGFAEDASYIPNGLYNSNPTFTIRNNVTKIVARHNLQFGAYGVDASKNELTGTAPSFNGFLTFDNSDSAVTSGNAFADLLTGNVSSFAQQNVLPKYHNSYKILEPYLQDDWRINDRLTLNLGFRLSLLGTYREKNHLAFNFDPQAYNPATAPGVDPNSGALVLGPGTNQFDGMVQCGVNGVPVSCMKGHLFNNPAPRIGFAYDPSGNGKMAIRGGYGIFFEHSNGNEANTESLEASPPLVQVPNQLHVGSTFDSNGNLLQSGYSQIGVSTAGSTPSFPLAITAIPKKAIWPYVQQWHLDLQREIVKNIVATFSYVGSKGTHLGREGDLNQLFPVPLSRNPYKPGEPINGTINPVTGLPVDCGTAFAPNGVPLNARTSSGVPITGQAAVNLAVAACGVNVDQFRPFRGYGTITLLEDKASSIYHGFQASLRHSVGALQLNVAYTFSHSIDDSSDRGDGSFVNSYDPSASRASSNFDQRHMLNIGYVCDLPFFNKATGLTNKLLGGWQLSGITTWTTGAPFSVGNNAQFGDNAGVGNGVVSQSSYADVIGDPKASINQSAAIVSGLGPLAYNPGAFALPRGLTFGDSGRNFLSNPNRTNFDMALFKHFAVKESMGFEFRAEAFNIFNHTEWAPLGGDTGSAAGSGLSSGTNSFNCFGGPNSSGGDPSCLGTASFLHFGAAHNPRILQLGLKFIF